MKTYEECLAWLEAVKAYRKSAPEGVYMQSKDKVITLRQVPPAVIIKLYNHFSTMQLPAGVKCVCTLEGSEEHAYCSLTIKKYGAMSYLLPHSSYRFFYRSESDV